MKKSLLLLIPLALFLGACEYTDGAHTEQSRAMEQNQKRLQDTYGIPQIEKSLEIENNHRRLEFLNKNDQVGYVYLLSYGQVVAYYTVHGKVSSLNSYSTAMEQIVNYRGVPCDDVTVSCSTGYIVEAPDIDGSYGKNVDGIYFFTTDGIYVEWMGDYMYTSEPLKLTQQPQLIRQVGE